MPKLLGTDEFVRRARAAHGNRYDYSQSEYFGWDTPISIICPVHGVFKQSPYHHTNGHGCRRCGASKVHQHNFWTLQEFLDRANAVHGNRYDYSKVSYAGIKDKITIICRLHGDFNQEAGSHIYGRGCPRCKQSNGERAIAELLDKKGIKYDRQAKLPSCKNDRDLRFDFILTTATGQKAIEYQGRQHYCTASFNHVNELTEFERLLRNDAIKRQWCRNNNVPLLEIPYWELNDIEDVIGAFLARP